MIGMSSVRKLQSITFRPLLHDVAEDEDERHDRDQDRTEHPGVRETVADAAARRDVRFEDPRRLFGRDDAHSAAFPA